MPHLNASTIALWTGILFSIIFTYLISWAGIYLENTPLAPDQGASWYYWQRIDPTVFSRISVWLLYFAHQIFLWGLIYFAQSNKYHYTSGLHKLNLLALGGNALFIILHLGQTQIFYDGLAQDVSIWSSFASVVIMLVWVLLMENNRRGLFFGKKVPFPQELIRFARQYHGYYFAWAIIYTFWYHPMISSSGHLIGFLYMFLLLLQSSLFFTTIHKNRFWTLVLEVSVLIHGSIVAIMQGTQMAPMFFFGFAGIFIISQMHGLGLKFWQRWIIFMVFIAGIYWFYADKGLKDLNEVIRIPAIDYIAVFVLALLLFIIMKLQERFKKD